MVWGLTPHKIHSLVGCSSVLGVFYKLTNGFIVSGLPTARSLVPRISKGEGENARSLETPYFFSSSVQLSTSVIGSLLSLTSSLLMRNFLPSAACFYGKLSLIP